MTEWIRTENDERAVADGCTFDERAAERVREFFRRFLRHSKGQWAGKPFELLDWQYRDVVGPLFGWKRADGTRRYRQAYIEIAKKNGKSALLSGLALYLLIADGEAGAEIYTAAADRDQASIIFNESAEMAKASEGLSSRLLITPSRKIIAFPQTASVLKALSAEAPTKEGINAHAVLFDELHAQRERTLWDTLRYAGRARRQPLLLAITTAGWDRKSICYEQRQYAEKVASGVIPDTSFLPVIYAADKDDDWTDELTWKKANPSLGVTFPAEVLASDCREARESPAKENGFKRYSLNIWTEQADRWLSLEKWDACAGPVDLEALKGLPCWAGLDLGATSDLTALVMLWKLDGGRWACAPRFWTPENCIERRSRKDSVPYNVWSKAGLLQVTPGDTTDYAFIRRDVGELAERFAFREVAVDRLFQGAQLATELLDDGHNVVTFGMGFLSMSAPTKELERIVLEGLLSHGGHPVLRWMASNVAVEIDAAGNMKPSKKHSTEKIDGIVALLMALGRAIAQRDETSVYESRGVITL